MTSEFSRLSLMRPVSRGGEPRSSIRVTCRRSNPQSAFWLEQGRHILGFMLFIKGTVHLQIKIQPSCTHPHGHDGEYMMTEFSFWDEYINGSKRKCPHLYHDVLQLVVRVRYVGRRHDQQPPLFIELIQEGGDRLHVWFNLHRYKHTNSQSCIYTHVQNI